MSFVFVIRYHGYVSYTFCQFDFNLLLSFNQRSTYGTLSLEKQAARSIRLRVCQSFLARRKKGTFSYNRSNTNFSSQSEIFGCYGRASKMYGVLRRKSFDWARTKVNTKNKYGVIIIIIKNSVQKNYKVLKIVFKSNNMRWRERKINSVCPNCSLVCLKTSGFILQPSILSC